MLGRRIIIARMLIAGISHDDVMQRLHVGKGTVRRVHYWLEDQFPGFERAIAEMEKVYANRSRRSTRGLEPFSAAWMRRRYPLMFWFIPESGRKRDASSLYPR